MMKNFFLPIFCLLFIGNAWATDIDLSTELPPQARVGDDIYIHVKLPSYVDDTLRFYIDVMDPTGRQVDSTLWFAREDFNYLMKTSHTAYDINQGGNFTINVERAVDNIVRTGDVVKTTSFFLLHPSPHYQMKKGIETNNILCNDGLQLIFKINGNPACVKIETVPKLITRGWAI